MARVSNGMALLVKKAEGLALSEPPKMLAQA